MKRIVVLGGCGEVGSVAVRALTEYEAFGEVVVGDIDESRGAQVIEQIGSSKLSFVRVDAGDADSIRRAIEGADIVVNCVGPFYKTVRTVLETVIEAGIDYVDICDDVDVTLEILDMDDRAKKAGVTALIGMGASPGATNLLAKFAHDTLLEKTDSIDIFHTHGGEPKEGPGVIGHRFHCMSIDIPMFLEGELRHVSYFEEDGMALRQTFDFPKVGNDIPIFPYPHPEQVTLPRYLELQQVTNKGSVLPIEYYKLTSELCRLGLASKDPLQVGDHEIVPYDFAVAFLIRERERILAANSFGQQRGCMTVVATGSTNGTREEYRIHLASTRRALGEGTGLPAAMGVVLLEQGKVSGPGVMPPEACIEPMDFITLWKEMEGRESAEEKNEEEGSTIIIEHRTGNGEIEITNL